jgi:aminoglycoside 3-N-acetyltransferase I
MNSTYTIFRLQPTHLAEFRALNALFATEFEDPAHYASAPPPDAYASEQLANPAVIALLAQAGNEAVGALVAYVLPKLEQARSEVYIYDLAVKQSHRRQGIATALIEALKPIARAYGAWVIDVQADYGDEPAIALYNKLGSMEEVMHFDIAVRPAPKIGVCG